MWIVASCGLACTARTACAHGTIPPGHGLTKSNGSPADAVKVALIVGHKHASCLTTRQRKKHIVRERLGEAADLEVLLASHVG